MGISLTFGKLLSDIIANPSGALQILSLSAKDITEILFFYFSELSFTACYVILFVLLIRFFIRKAPKIYSYALWGVVYFKLISCFKFKIPNISLIPQAEIDTVYINLMPERTFFYSGEAGVVSIVQSDLMASVPVVTPMYLPAFIWFTVLVVITVVSLFFYLKFKNSVKNGNCANLKDNVYICDNIKTPFVVGIFKPQIYLPNGLTEQQQKYVITHENVHIKRGDHIIKMFAFMITVIHWFNPLVWLSFFLLEKDMEMSCDEKVLQIMGNEHKKDYSYCILSLAADKKFVPKAYLSFGDSDTKKRIKNVLDYKKPKFWVALVSVIVVICVAFCMLSKDRYTLPPDYSTDRENSFAAMENNFPKGFDSFNITFAAMNTTVGFHLPDGWSVVRRNIQLDERPEYLTIDDSFSDVVDIYNHKNEYVGAMGFLSYTEYLGNETNINAIYSPVSLPNMYHFEIDENYFAVEYDENGLWETATTKVYHSPQLNRDLGYAEKTTYGDGILAYDRETLSIVAFEFRENYFSEGELRYIATSLDIRPNSNFDSVASAVLSMQYRNMETGSDFDVSEYVTDDVLTLLEAKEEIAKHRIRIFGVGKDSYNVQVIPVETESWVQEENYAEIKMQVLRTFRYNTANFDSSTSEVVNLQLERGATGYWTVTHYCIDGKDLTFNDMDVKYWESVENGSGQQFLDEFVQEYKSFIGNISSVPMVAKSNTTPFPVVNQWDMSLNVAAESSPDSYVITYCDEKITCGTGLLTIENKNNFDIAVHLSHGGSNEIVMNVAPNTSTAFAIDTDTAEYTVGIHADVAEDTVVNLVIYENTHN